MALNKRVFCFYTVIYLTFKITPQNASVNTCMNIPKEIYERLVFEKPSKTAELEPTRVKEIKDELRPCGDCGRLKRGRKIHSKVMQTPCAHWRHQCLGCRMYKDPATGVFDIHLSEAESFFRRYYKQKNK